MFSQNEFEGNFFKVNISSLCDFISALAALPMRNKDFTHPFSISLALSRFHSHTHNYTYTYTHTHTHTHSHTLCSLPRISTCTRTHAALFSLSHLRPGVQIQEQSSLSLLPPNLSVDVTLDLPPYNKF